MLERIRELLAARDLSSTQFADTIGVSRPVVSHILSGRNKPSLEVVQKITGAFPDLSLPWLLNGEGPMIAPPVAPPPPPEPAVASEPIKRPPAPVVTSLPDRTAKAVAPAPQEPSNTLGIAPPTATIAPAPAETLAAPSQAAGPLADQDAATVPTAPVAAPGPKTTLRPTIPLAAPPAEAELAQALATPGKRIRRIVIFYQDGTFADYQPESGS